MAGSASNKGFHYYQVDQKCPWKFNLMYRHHLRPRVTAEALLNGQTFHLAKEKWYETFSEKEALTAINDSLRLNRREYGETDQFNSAAYRLPHMLKSWIKTWGEFDKDNYNILAVELPLEIPVAGTPYSHTMRLDLVIADKRNGYIYIMDTKTTGFTIESMQDTLHSSDQVTAYLWGLKKAWPDKPVVGFIGDITFWSKRSKNIDLIKNVRTDVIHRSDQSLKEYENQCAYRIKDVSARVDAVNSGKFDETTLFPRYTHTCTAFFRKCEFWYICRDYEFNDKIAPPGLEFDPRGKSIDLTSNPYEVINDKEN